MSIFRRDARGRAAGFRCDWCGKIANNPDGEYERPVRNERGCKLAGHIHAPHWDQEGSDDICEECASDLCPYCGSPEVVRVTPASPGPVGWGGRCKACNKEW